MRRWVAVQSSDQLWGWTCIRCGQVDASRYPSRDHAMVAGRGHVGTVHGHAGHRPADASTSVAEGSLRMGA